MTGSEFVALIAIVACFSVFLAALAILIDVIFNIIQNRRK